MRRVLLAAMVAALVLGTCGRSLDLAGRGTGALQRYDFDPAHPYAAGQHRGVDVGADTGSLVAAPAAGTVTFAGSVPSSGKSLTITTSDGYAVTLTHLGTIAVAEGATVAEGDAVGTVGPSGDPELAQPYLHLGIRVAAEAQGYLDPLTLLPSRPSAPAAPTPAPEPAPAAPTVQPAPVVQPAAVAPPAADSPQVQAGAVPATAAAVDEPVPTPPSASSRGRAGDGGSALVVVSRRVLPSGAHVGARSAAGQGSRLWHLESDQSCNGWRSRPAPVRAAGLSSAAPSRESVRVRRAESRRVHAPRRTTVPRTTAAHPTAGRPVAAGADDRKGAETTT